MAGSTPSPRCKNDRNVLTIGEYTVDEIESEIRFFGGFKSQFFSVNSVYVGYSPNTTSEALLTTNALLDSKKNPVLGCPHHFHVFPTFRMPLSNWVYAVALQIRELLKVRLDMRPKQKQNEKRQNKTKRKNAPEATVVSSSHS
jgi:hypothetical protein